MTTLKLSSVDIHKKMEKMPLWSLSAKEIEISRTIHVATFVAGLALAAKVAVHAEILNHHPSIELSYGKVKIKISTHDAKGLTKLDFELAKRIDTLSILI